MAIAQGSLSDKPGSDPAKKNKLFIMGLDGGTWDVLRPLMEAGKLPHISGLAERGISGILNSTIPPETASAWTTFQTGVNPGKHGITAFSQYQPGEYKPFFISSRTIPQETIWQILGRHGQKVIAVNVPITYPAYKVNGLMLTCMLTPSVKSNFSYPPELVEEILGIEKDYTIVTTQEIFNRMTLEEFTETVISTEEKRTRVMLHLLRKYDWDAAMIHFHSSDPLQHAVYWYLDKKSPFFDPEKYQVIEKFYRAIDHNIGQLSNALPPDTLKIVLSDHGFCSIYKTININNLLCQKGFMSLKNKGLINKNILALITLLRKLNKNVFRFDVSSRKRAALRETVKLDEFIEWPRTKACMINGWLYGFIYLNCVGREKQGIVHPGEEYDHVRNSIIEILAGLKDPETGKKVIQKVLKREEIYHGELLDRAPDLIAIPEDGYEFCRTFLEKPEDLFSENRIKRDHTGSHKREGIFIFEGPMIDGQKTLSAAAIEDMLPTILYFFDDQIPDYVDGRVLAEIFRQDFLENKPVRFEPQADKGYSSKGEGEFSEEEKKEIEKRLKELGYVE